jgi:hypothetical protein
MAESAGNLVEIRLVQLFVNISAFTEKYVSFSKPIELDIRP